MTLVMIATVFAIVVVLPLVLLVVDLLRGRDADPFAAPARGADRRPHLPPTP